MKKISVLVLVIMLMAAGVAQADNSQRIAEVKKIGQQAEKNVKFYKAEVRKQENTIVWSNSIVGELQRQDVETEKEARWAEEEAKKVEIERVENAKLKAEAEKLKKDTKGLFKKGKKAKKKKK